MERWAQRWNQGVTLLILVNLLLVLFNLSYVSLRGIYLHYWPTLVQLYDPVKGIDPHPVTQTYLATVDQLQQTIRDEGLESAETEAILADLRQQSRALINEDPFLASNQMAIFAKLKRRMRGYLEVASAEAAFNRFWQTSFLSEQGWADSQAFFDSQIRPLLRRNYYRETLETGQYIDEFWRLDLIFIAVFGGELLLRTLIISRRREEVSWGDAIARRWYELPLLLPFWRWLRVIPAAVRLHRTGLLNVERLLSQATHEPAAYLSDRVSKFMLVRLVNQTQDSVRTGAMLSTFRDPTSNEHVSVGHAQKIEQLSDRLLQLVIYKALPNIKPDLEDLLRHSLRGALTRSDFYVGLRRIPGLQGVPAEALDALSNYLAEATCDVITESYADTEGRRLVDQLSQDFRVTLSQELQDQATATEIETLLSDLLEELKLNYIQQADRRDPQLTLAEVEQLDQPPSTQQ